MAHAIDVLSGRCSARDNERRSISMSENEIETGRAADGAPAEASAEVTLAEAVAAAARGEVPVGAALYDADGALLVATGKHDRGAVRRQCLRRLYNLPCGNPSVFYTRPRPCRLHSEWNTRRRGKACSSPSI